MRDAASQGATYIQTPEMTGAIVRDREARTRCSRPRTATRSRRRDAARCRTRHILHIGSTPILRADGKLANRALLFGPDGKIITTYDKIHMFDVDLDNGESWRESAAYEPGRKRSSPTCPCAARLRHLLRSALSATVPRRGAGRRRCADRSGRLHPADRRGALARAAARPRHREWRLRRRRGAGRTA